MKMCNVKIYKSGDDACRALATQLVALAKRGGTVALSGGTTPKVMFRILAEQYHNTDWSHIKFFWGDERLVPASSDESNYGEFRRILVDTGVIPPEVCFPSVYEGDEQATLLRTKSDIAANVSLKNHLPSFDLMILGVGDDGHVASIFPDNMQSFYSTEAVELVTQPRTLQRRITVTGSVINNAHEVVMLCVGAHKQNIVTEVVYKHNHTLPASLVQPLGTMTWFVDESAAGKIE